MKNLTNILCAALVVLVAVGCQQEAAKLTPVKLEVEAPTKPLTAKILSYKVERVLPHNTKAFTQGLQIHNGVFYESTGGYGTSSVRRVEVATGKILTLQPLEARIFGEGLAVVDGKVFVLSWLNQLTMIFDDKKLEKIGQFLYAGEGWGLTTDGTTLYMSNGTHVITQRDATDGHMLGSVGVMLNGLPCNHLNELEWIEGEIWANVWRTNNIVRIDPRTGIVKSVVDLTGLLDDSERTANTDVLNGIAYNTKTKAIYVTGKNWPHIYQISVME
ncbi:MAG: glutaminyl-peptide cyclotransferase [Ignavibacteria bacterium]|nr:glutaminyl-peptide cyclotransferase [Ignavibacteria bacterium]